MKRTILILILALLSTVAFAGCGNTGKESAKDTTEIVQPTDDEVDDKTDDETDDKTDDETDDKTDDETELKPVTPVSNGGNFKAN